MRTGTIYKIRNKFNSKVYIGSSINYTKRLETHKRLLRNNKHHAYKLQRAWNKYGEAAFEIEIIEEALFSDILEINYILQVLECIEQYYINQLNAASNYNYNTSDTAGSFRSLNPSETTKKSWETRKANGNSHFSLMHKKNLSQSLKNSVALKEALKINGKGRRKRIYQYNLNGLLVGEWDSIYELIENNLNLKYAGIRKVLSGEKIQYKGYIFSHGKSEYLLPRKKKERVKRNG